MIFKPYPGTRKALDLLPAIAPVFRIDTQNGTVHLIGTGFWVTQLGHLVTAWHVIEENTGSSGMDRGPIFAVQTFPDRSLAVRNFRKSDKHPTFDLALSETAPSPPYEDRPTSPIAMSLDNLRLGEPVFSFAILPLDHAFENETVPGITTAEFVGTISGEGMCDRAPISFAARLSFGHVTEIFDKMRDSRMLPFPCIQTSVPIYGGNSGGPLFDIRGRICAVHCSSFSGSEVSFHVPIQGVLDLRTRAKSLGMEDQARTQLSVLELAVEDIVFFDPPMLDVGRPFRSARRWLRHVARRIAGRELPSRNVHFLKHDR